MQSTVSHSIITLAGLSYATPDGHGLFDNLDLNFGAERTGLVGRNGVGKTTLLRLILGELAPSGGSVSVRGRVGLLRQLAHPPLGANLADLLGVSDDLARLRRLEAGEGAQDDLALADWNLGPRLDAALAQVDLTGLDLDRPAASLSGGEATRAMLAGLLAAEFDMLVLDEPTNNLDARAREIVSETLGRWRGGAIVVSHDRHLLRRMDRTVELSQLGARIYGGGFDLYAERKAEERTAAERDVASAGRDVARSDREAQAAREKKARSDAAGRRFAASGSAPKIVLGAMAERAENSGSREGELAARLGEAARDRLARARTKVERLRLLAFDLPPSGLPSGRMALSADDLAFAYPDGRRLLHGISLKIVGAERVAITGANGSGKTTLLRLLAGELAPMQGQVVAGVSLAMLDQKTSILREDDTVLENFWRLNPQDSDNACRSILARFLFRADAALKRVGELSGGERIRAALACVIGGTTPPQLLILDEPTNHLDLDSIGAIEAALCGYDGALLAVSHDAEFLEAIGVQRRIELTPAC